MKKIVTGVALVCICVFSQLGCGSKKPALTVEEKALELHSRMLSVDTHCDTAFSLLREDWKIGDRHDSGERGSGKLDLPRMREGRLDAEFFAAFVGQGPRTEEGFARARSMSSDRLRGWSQTALALEWEAMMGASLTSRTSKKDMSEA